MPAKQLKNFVQHVLTVAALSTDVTLTWDSVSGWATVGDFFLRLDNPGLTVSEIVKVTAVNVGANQTTVVRNQEGSGASAFAINSTGGNDLTAQTLVDAFARLDTSLSQDLTGPLRVPATLGGAYGATSYGSMPVKITEFLLAATSADIAFTSIPAGFRHLKFDWYARGDTAALTSRVNVRLNNDSTANYDEQEYFAQAAANSPSETLGTSVPSVGFMNAASAVANYFAQGSFKIAHYLSAVGNKLLTAECALGASNVTTGLLRFMSTVKWRTTGAPVTQVDILFGAGNAIIGSLFTLQGEP